MECFVRRSYEHSLNSTGCWVKCSPHLPPGVYCYIWQLFLGHIRSGEWTGTRISAHAHMTHTFEHYLCASTVLEVRSVAGCPHMADSGTSDKLRIKIVLTWFINGFWMSWGQGLYPVPLWATVVLQDVWPASYRCSLTYSGVVTACSLESTWSV